MERNIHHVQRWLERCLEAYRHRRHGAALAELESARAELEIARARLAEELAGQQKPSGCRPERLFRVALTSVIMLLALALPTARLTAPEGQAPFLLSLRPEGTSLEVVTEEERALLENLRRVPAVAEVPSLQRAEQPREMPSLSARALQAEQRPLSVQAPEPLSPEKIPVQAAIQKPGMPDSDTLKGNDSAPSVEEVLSLLQAGQRALQHPGKGIQIQP